MCGDSKLKPIVLVLVLVLSFWLSTVCAKNDEIYKLLKEGKEKIKLSQNKNIILMLGNTGSGEKKLLRIYQKSSKTHHEKRLICEKFMIRDKKVDRSLNL